MRCPYGKLNSNRNVDVVRLTNRLPDTMADGLRLEPPLDRWLALSLEDVARLIRLRGRLRLPPVVDAAQLESLLGPGRSAQVFAAFAGGHAVASVLCVLCGCVLASHGGGYDAKAALLFRVFDLDGDGLSAHRG